MKFFSFLLVLTGLSLSPSSRACSYPNLRKVNVPVYPQKLDSPHFEYIFQYYPGSPSLPTIIVVPGGPGFGMIGKWNFATPNWELKDLALPKGAGVVFIDPRTVDCNLGNKNLFPDRALNTEFMANDILSAIRSLNLKDYVIYGYSYGTVLATVLASQAEKDGGPLPRAVVLTGVIGQSEKSNGDGSVFKWLNLEWQKIKPQIPSKAMERLKKPHFMGFDEYEWADIIEDGIYKGIIVRDGVFVHPLKEALSLFAKGNTRADNEALEMLGTFHEWQEKQIGPSIKAEKWSQRLFEVVDCAELTDTEPDQTLVNGEFVKADDNCTHREKLIRPFSATNWPIHAPIFYFEGNADPATPIWQGKKHFAMEKTSLRNFMTLPGGGHQWIGPYLGDCKESLWKSIFIKGNELVTALNTCKAIKLLCEGKSCNARNWLQTQAPSH